MSKRACVDRFILAIGLVLSLSTIRCSDEKPVSLPALPELKMDEMLAVNREQIQKFYAQALQTPNNAEAVGRLGMVLHAYQQHESAEPCYDRAHLLQPDDLRWAYYLGTIRFLLGQDDAAVVALRTATNLNPQYLPAQLRLADTLLSLGELDDAETRYERVLEQDGQSMLAYYGLGKVHSKRGDIQTAINYFSRACEISESFPGAHYALALAYRDTGQSKKAEEHFALHEKYASVSVALNDPLLAALKELKVSGANEPFQEGLRLADTGNLKEAAEAFERAVEVNPGLVQARINLISLYARLGQPVEAERQYLQAVETDPERADLHFNYGVLAEEKGEIQAAQGAFEKALSIDPEYAEAHNGLGQILAAQGRADEAIQHFQSALAGNPNDRFAHSNLGRLLFLKGQQEEGLQHFLRTLEPQDEQTPGYLFDTAVAFAMAGDREKAVHYAQQARRQAVSLGQDEVVQLAKEILQDLGQAEIE